MKKTSARGYFLEIILSRLIEVNGYELIRKKDDDTIFMFHNSLNVKGRGGYHQFDVLGQFKTTPPFTYPLRLFVEAKFLDKPLQINSVRQGVGILQDLNSNLMTVDLKKDELLMPNYNYNYSIFSASGFYMPAQRMALAHKIHLIDLSGDEYKEILTNIDKIVNSLSGTDDIDKDVYNDFKKSFTEYYLDEYDNKIPEDYFDNDEIIKSINELNNIVGGNSMILMSTDGPYIIPLLVSSDIISSFIERPHRYIDRISFLLDDVNHSWTLHLTINDNQVDLKFKLPELLSNYIMKDLNKIQERASHIKEQIFKRFSFVIYSNGDPTFCTLTYSN